MTQAQRDSAWASGRECHPAAIVGERATPEQQRWFDILNTRTDRGAGTVTRVKQSADCNEQVRLLPR